ncbi:MAG: FAD-linked oxidase C-terminal domain-containing protein [candidate division KSB1 bacterium]|nr:FAD-linked oxidase C-terminal domain-containing protein [candidate division KSB1 bacterium]
MSGKANRPMLSQEKLNDFFNELKKRVDGELRTDRYTRVLYSTDASIYQVMPLGVLFPKSVDDVQAAVELAHRFELPILPRTAGTSLAGQAVNEALVIDFTPHMDAIVAINPEEHWVRVQPGRVLDELNLALAKYGLQFGPDPASSNRAAMGGIVSNNSTGSHSILYGMTADHLLEVTVILSDGSQATFGPVGAADLQQKKSGNGFESTIYREFHELVHENENLIREKTPRHWRRCGGYNLDRFVDGPSFRYPRDPRFNLAQVIAGSEGTLAVITEVKLNIVPKPKHTALAIVQFDALYDALAATPVILETDPSAVELLDQLALRLSRNIPEYARLLKTFISGDPHCVLITEFYGDTPQEASAKVERLRKHLQKQRVGTEIVPVIEPAHQANVWAVRKVGLGLIMGMKGDHKPLPFIEDAAVPVEHLAEYVTRIEKFCNDLGNRVTYYAHASAGCIHIRPVINAKDAADVEKLPKISQFAVELLGQYGGALSSEHGDGRSRSWLNEQFFGREMYALFKRVKQIFDPGQILNPGIIVDGQPMTENLRYGPGYSTISIQEHLDFSEDQGFHRAVEMCNGAGICRKRTIGTMCPSFMATRDEMHSTRGRANALRAALSGLLPPEEFTSPHMYQLLDLCIECKGCKAECPSSVDMAKVKFEFLAHYYEKHGVPLRSQILGNFHVWQKRARRLKPLANLGVRNGLSRKLMETLLGLTSERSLPTFANQDFLEWFHGRPNAKGTDLETVAIFYDCFNTYHEPDVLIAAVQVLEAAGYRVVLSGHECCGRTMISKGLVNEARAAAEATVRALRGFADQGTAIIGLEPSCLLTLRDEYRYLLPGNADVDAIARNSFLFEEFLALKLDSGEVQLNIKPDHRPIILHGHCHQKALVGTAATKALLGRISGDGVDEVDSGCCGMAGSFGYEKEHYQISMAIGERRLLPYVRSAPEQAVVAAPGFSCRSQIEHGAGRKAKHPAQILRDALQI